MPRGGKYTTALHTLSALITRSANTYQTRGLSMSLQSFTAAYCDALFWSEVDHDSSEPMDKNYGVSNLAPEARTEIVEQCRAFYEQNTGLFDDDSQAGHDFALTRNRHGAGFWGRPEMYGAENSKLLTSGAHDAKEQHLYVGDDGQVYT